MRADDICEKRAEWAHAVYFIVLYAEMRASNAQNGCIEMNACSSVLSNSVTIYVRRSVRRQRATVDGIGRKDDLHETEFII